MARAFLLQRGSCCGNKCINCPYIPKHTKGTMQMQIIENIHYDMNGEVIKRTYSILTPDEFGYLKRFKSYGEARQFIKEHYAI